MTAAGIIFFAYIGFDAVSTAAQEARNPQRDMPIGILVSLAICTVLYIGVAAVLTGMVPYPELNTPAPVAMALDRYPGLQLARRLGEARRDRRHDLDDAGDAARPAAHLLRDVQGRPAAAGVRAGAPEIQDAVVLDACSRAWSRPRSPGSFR